MGKFIVFIVFISYVLSACTGNPDTTVNTSNKYLNDI